MSSINEDNELKQLLDHSSDEGEYFPNDQSSKQDKDGMKTVLKRERKEQISFPKILKHDVRREFGVMFTNVMNSADCNFLGNFFTKFCTPATYYMEYNPIGPLIFNKPPVRVGPNLACMVGMLSHYAVNMPDYSNSLVRCSIVPRTDCPGSKIVLQMRYAGTMPVPSFVVTDPCERVLSKRFGQLSVDGNSNQMKPEEDLSQVKVVVAAEMDHHAQVFPSGATNVPFPQQFVPVSGPGTIIFYLDQELQVTRVENFISLDDCIIQQAKAMQALQLQMQMQM